MINKIRYKNLRAEMARNKVTIQNIATVLNCSRDTAGYKLAGKRPIHLNEAVDINKTFFPDKELLYLFEELNNRKES